MEIERQMRAVKRDVVFEREFQLPSQRTGHALQSRPEQTVMHDEKINILLCRGSENACRNIHRRSNFRNFAGIFDLQTVQGIRPISNLLNAQIIVRVVDNLGKCRHDPAAIVAVFVSKTEL